MLERQFEPVDDLMAASCALRFLVDSFQASKDYGPSKLLDSLAEEISQIANLMDDEKWGPIKKA